MTGVYVVFVLMATSQAMQVTFNTDAYDYEELETKLLQSNKAMGFVKDNLGQALDLIFKMDRKINLLTDTVKQQGEKIETMEKKMDKMKETFQKQSADIANYEYDRQVLNKTVDELYKQMRRKLIKCIKEPNPGRESNSEMKDFVDKIEHIVTNGTNVEGHKKTKLPALIYSQAVKNGKPQMLLKKIREGETSDISVIKRLLGHSATTQQSTRVAFSAYLTHELINMGIGHTIKPDGVYLNDGNSYNPRTGIFTVPSSGVYLLTYTIDSLQVNHGAEVELVVDNVSMGTVRAQTESTSHHESATKIILTHLNPGQSVWLQTTFTDNSEISSNGVNKFVTFSGVLLYQ